MRRFGRVSARLKSRANLVTAADLACEQKILDIILKKFPHHDFITEERPPRRNGGAYAWIIDPIDGTNNYAGGTGPFGILIALADEGLAQSGWIYDCLSGRFCAAHRGKGAFVGGERIVAKPSGETPPVAGISTLFMDQSRRAAVMEYIAPHYRLVDIPRCAAEQYPRLALGENDVSIFERTLAWDHAAGALWLNEAGGKCARPDGSPYRVDEKDRTGLIGAASPALWDDLAARYAMFEA